MRRPVANEEIRYLASWSCESCVQASFAEVVFEHGRVRSIEHVDLSVAVVDRLHFISQDVEDMLRPIVDGSLFDERALRSNWLDLVRAGLRAGRRWP